MTAYHRDGLAALADPTSRAIFECLANGPLPVGRLALLFPVSRPAVSQHLKVLKDAGLVVDERVGNCRLYSLNPSGIAELRTYLDRFWTRTLLAHKKAAVEQEHHKLS